MSDLLRIAEDVLTDHAPTTCDQLNTCACSMAALHREVRHLRARQALALRHQQRGDPVSHRIDIAAAVQETVDNMLNDSEGRDVQTETDDLLAVIYAWREEGSA